MGFINSAVRAGVEGFVGTNSSEKRREAYVDFVSITIALVIMIILMGFIGKWLWNNVIVDLFSFAKPARSFGQMVGLMVFSSLVIP